MTEALDANLIRSVFSELARDRVDDLTRLDIVPSTNTWLMNQQRPEPGRFCIALAEQQTSGRGRQGKRWVSPRGAGLYLSIGYTFLHSPKSLSCVTLAAGVAVVQALEKLGARRLKLKWPNDIYAGNAKLGGILTDAQTGAGGRITVICGIGINLDLSLTDVEQKGLDNLDYTVTDLTCHSDEVHDRPEIAGAVINRVVRAFTIFETHGLKPFRADWNGKDWLRGKSVDVDMPGSTISGIADGIDANGALRVVTDEGARRVFTGTVRARKVREA